MFFGFVIGMQEVLIGAAVIFLLFGASRLPQLAKALGQSKKAFKEGLKEGEMDDAPKAEITNGNVEDSNKI
jgi:sec-independent protein translocase protein TatA